MNVYDALNRWDPDGFVWGRSDCCQFASYVIRELTGRDLMPWTYSSEQEAVDLIVAHGGLSQTVTAVLKREPVAVSLLQPGDPVIWVAEQGDTFYEGLGVVLRNAFAWVSQKSGRVGTAALGHCRHGWRVV